MNDMFFIAGIVLNDLLITGWGLVVVAMGLVMNGKRFLGRFPAFWLATCCTISGFGHVLSLLLASKYPAYTATFLIIAIAATLSYYWSRFAQEPPTGKNAKDN